MARREKLVWPYGPIATTYATAELIPENTSRGVGVMLLLDGAQSSYLEMEDPQYLMFEYMQYMQCVVREAMKVRHFRDFVHLGGAGCAFPRALIAQYPRTRHQVIEYDALLAEYVRDWFDLPRSPALRIRVADARAAIESLKPGSRDVITRDVFADRLVPHHTRTAEFFSRVATALRDGGFFLANTGSQPGQHELRREVASMLPAFRQVFAIAEPATLKGRRPGNVVLLGSHEPIIDPDELNRQLRRLPLAPVMWDRRKLEQWAASAQKFHDTADPVTDSEQPLLRNTAEN